jgi:hypothetical protein
MRIAHSKKLAFVVFLFCTAFSILKGQATVFYVIYFFWWSEFIRIITGRLFYKKENKEVAAEEKQDFLVGNLILMAIYLVFIVLFFGLFANWNNKEISLTNMDILFFQNWFFNGNLIFVLVERIYLLSAKKSLSVKAGVFTSNMLVLHISIVLGGILLFFIVKKYPNTFTPENLWGSVIIILPFLLLKGAVHHFSNWEEES